MSTTVLVELSDGQVEEHAVADNYLVVYDGTADVTAARLVFEEDGTYTHRLTIRGCRFTPPTNPVPELVDMPGELVRVEPDRRASIAELRDVLCTEFGGHGVGETSVHAAIRTLREQKAERDRFERMWKQLSKATVRMQNLLNEAGLCDDCGQATEDGNHPDPVAVSTCVTCGESIGLMSSCCWSGPDAIWLHNEPQENCAEAAVSPEEERRIATEAEEDDLLTMREQKAEIERLRNVIGAIRHAVGRLLQAEDAETVRLQRGALRAAAGEPR